jgi:hypothetical protein
MTLYLKKGLRKKDQKRQVTHTIVRIQYNKLNEV